MRLSREIQQAKLPLGVVIGMLLIAGAAGCGDVSSPNPGGTGEPDSLSVSLSVGPPLAIPNYRTQAVYLQVHGKDSLEAVNEAMRDVLIRDQHQYEKAAEQLRSVMPDLFTESYRHPGVYETRPERELVSASTALVSALIPVRKLYPGGNGGDLWISLTVEVPSGKTITLDDLFTDPTTGLEAISSAARRAILSTNDCVRATNSAGFEPRLDNYRYFALTPAGLAIGFPIGRIGSPSCSSVCVTLDYSALRPHVSKLGERLIAGVRRPKFDGDNGAQGRPLRWSLSTRKTKQCA